MHSQGARPDNVAECLHFPFPVCPDRRERSAVLLFLNSTHILYLISCKRPGTANHGGRTEVTKTNITRSNNNRGRLGVIPNQMRMWQCSETAGHCTLVGNLK